jgi:HAD superfamily hydrolase (TIGR01459 family)
MGMNRKTIKGLVEIHKKYDAFFIDIWGVIHNGIKLYPGAIEVLENLLKSKKRLVLMSNAPRPSKKVEGLLKKMKINKIFFKYIFTSGEAALKSLQKNVYGKKFFHLGPKRDDSLFKGFEENKKDLSKADFILCTGFLDGHEADLDYYKNLLKNFTKIKMVCTNPDLVVHRGLKEEYCAGTLAALFKELGGKVIYFGKPHPQIYKLCVKKNEKILVIGDNILTDIKGANNMKFDSLLITHGIHKDEFLNLPSNKYDRILKKYHTSTNYYQERLIW